jgi:hypothetical protein
MSDLHEAFDGWLTRGARDDLPRAVALHASACPGCRRAAGAFDALAAIDLEAAELPPLRVAPTPMDRRRGLVPATVAAVAVLLVIGGGIVAGGTLLRPPDEPDVAIATPTVGEGVLGDQGGPQSSASGGPMPSASPEATATGSAEPSSTPGPVAPNPTMGGGPPLATPALPTVIPRPTAAPSPRPTVRPTAAPTPTPTPTPVPPPECSNLKDDDGDGFVDFPQDPGCSSSSDEEENIDADGDGVPDHLDECPLEPPGDVPDPVRPGCPLIP